MHDLLLSNMHLLQLLIESHVIVELLKPLYVYLQASKDLV
jgi:hypothetical protein